MPPTRTPLSVFRAFSRFPHSNLRTVRISGPRLYRQPQQLPHSRLFSSSFQPFGSLQNEAPKQPQKTRLVEQPENSQPPSPKRPEQPSYDITFTCTPCSTRSTHRITKHAYHHGSILITCPSCRNRHVISDHLKIFGDKYKTIEDLMRDRGQLVKKGTLSEDGDLEFWEDGSTTTRTKDDGLPATNGQKSLE